MVDHFRNVGARRAAVWMVVTGLVLGAVFFIGAGQGRNPVHASTPARGTLAIPAGGVGPVSTFWSGQVPAGTNALALRCADFDPVLSALTDSYLLQLSGVSDAFYLTHRVQL